MTFCKLYNFGCSMSWAADVDKNISWGKTKVQFVLQVYFLPFPKNTKVIVEILMKESI